MRALLLVLALSSVAHADEIATDPQPEIVVRPAKPATPRDHLLGVMFGAANTQIRDIDRTLITIGATWGRELARRRLYALAEYEWCMTLGTDPAMESVLGRAHVLRTGVRLDVLSKQIRNDGKLYAGLEGQAGVMYGGDTELGTYLVPNAMIGARSGFEIWPRNPEQSPSSAFGFFLRAGAMLTRDDAGFVFAIGLDWANRPRL